MAAHGSLDSHTGSIRAKATSPRLDGGPARRRKFAMLHRLRLAHRLLLIYLLSFVAVAVLAYGLIAEKNIAIDFALKELRGNAYVAVVRNALLTITENRLTAVAPQRQSGIERKAALQRQAVAVETAERQQGEDRDT